MSGWVGEWMRRMNGSTKLDGWVRGLLTVLEESTLAQVEIGELLNDVVLLLLQLLDQIL